jgi:predicted transglutaminase-like cysteine proteinase
MVSFMGLDLLKPENSRSALFGTSEVKSKNIGPFTKWTDMFRRFEKEFHTASNNRAVNQWRAELQPLTGLPLEQKVIQVNKMMNDVAYAPDTQTWGKTDFWATPIEFMESASGDCEDYAIAKYASLRALGVPDSRMRIVILQDTAKNLAHAILAVYADSGVMILDNQAKTVRYDYEISNYKPIYSINREGWWLHKAMQPTLVASR